MRNIKIFSFLAIVQDVSQPWWRYIPLTFLIAYVPSLILSILFNYILSTDTTVEFGELTSSLVVSLTIVAPLVETLLMWPLIYLIQRFLNRNSIIVAAISALIWAAFHALQTPVWGLTVFWSFFIFSLCFVSWRKVSLTKALLFTFLIHVIQNVVSVSYLLLRGA